MTFMIKNKTNMYRLHKVNTPLRGNQLGLEGNINTSA